MATVGDVLAAAEFARTYIYRDQRTGRVSIQNDGPWKGKYGDIWVEHCDLSVGWIYDRAGLARDEWANEGFTITSVNRYRRGNGAYRGDLRPRVADSGYMDWQDTDGLGGRADATDHVELLTGPVLMSGGKPVLDEDGIPLIDTSGGYVETLGWNTTADGRGYRYRRPLAYFTCFGHPRLDGVAAAPAARPATTLDRARMAVPAYA